MLHISRESDSRLGSLKLVATIRNAGPFGQKQLETLPLFFFDAAAAMTSSRSTFSTKEEWQAEMARLRAERERCSVSTTEVRESRAERVSRKSSERSYAAEIEKLRERSETICRGVSPDEVAKWPKAPKYLEGGIVQKMTPDDPVEEVAYTLEDVFAWRAHVTSLSKCRDALRCGNCYSIEPKPPLQRMARCGACKRVRYCSRACQKDDFPRHRRLCGQLSTDNTY